MSVPFLGHPACDVLRQGREGRQRGGVNTGAGRCTETHEVESGVIRMRVRVGSHCQRVGGRRIAMHYLPYPFAIVFLAIGSTLALV